MQGKRITSTTSGLFLQQAWLNAFVVLVAALAVAGMLALLGYEAWLMHPLALVVYIIVLVLALWMRVVTITDQAVDVKAGPLAIPLLRRQVRLADGAYHLAVAEQVLTHHSSHHPGVSSRAKTWSVFLCQAGAENLAIHLAGFGAEQRDAEAQAKRWGKAMSLEVRSYTAVQWTRKRRKPTGNRPDLP